ncbi:MAG TPA: thioredoxin domain-containing protein [Candidatus Nitrosotenuis sp.]|nr:thioredoxin domain-containing protein [Candidatus Nitrosotenuis sp.]
MTAKILLAVLALSSAVCVAETAVKSTEATSTAKEVETEPAVEHKQVSSFTKEQTDEIKRIVAQTLSDNPEHVVKAIQNFGEQEQQKQIKAMDEAIAQNKDKLTGPQGAILLGNKGGPIKLVVFLDPNCPHCRRFDKILQEIEKDHSKLEIVYRLLPILGEKSVETSRVLLAASLIDGAKFHKLIAKVAISQEPLDKSRTLQIAKESGFDPKVIEEKMTSEDVKKAIEVNSQLAQDINLQGTPTSILADNESIKVIMPTDKKSLEDLLSAARTIDAQKQA